MSSSLKRAPAPAAGGRKKRVVVEKAKDADRGEFVEDCVATVCWCTNDSNGSCLMASNCDTILHTHSVTHMLFLCHHYLVVRRTVLGKCRKLRDELRAKAEFEESNNNDEKRSLPAGVPSDIVEVAELPANQVLSKKGFNIDIPSRASTNQIYVKVSSTLEHTSRRSRTRSKFPLFCFLLYSFPTPSSFPLAHALILFAPKKEWDRIVLGGKRSTRSFLNVKESRKTAITLRVLQLVHAVLVKRIHITKRDLFYTDVKLFVDQAESDGVLDDVATMIGCTRSNLHVVASDKGLVVGRIQFEEDGDYIDCTKMGVGGKAIPPYIDKIENIQSDAEFILLVEKEAAYMRMAEDRFYHRYPCIVITAKGQPDVATRMFLSRITAELKIPVLGLVDRFVV